MNKSVLSQFNQSNLVLIYILPVKVWTCLFLLYFDYFVQLVSSLPDKECIPVLVEEVVGSQSPNYHNGRTVVPYLTICGA